MTTMTSVVIIPFHLPFPPARLSESSSFSARPARPRPFLPVSLATSRALPPFPLPLTVFSRSSSLSPSRHQPLFPSPRPLCSARARARACTAEGNEVNPLNPHNNETRNRTWNLYAPRSRHAFRRDTPRHSSRPNPRTLVSGASERVEIFYLYLISPAPVPDGTRGDDFY